MRFGPKPTGPVEAVNIPRYLFNAMENQIEEQQVEINLLKESLRSANRKRLETEARHEKTANEAAAHIKGLREEIRSVYQEARDAKRDLSKEKQAAETYKASAESLKERLDAIHRLTTGKGEKEREARIASRYVGGLF